MAWEVVVMTGKATLSSLYTKAHRCAPCQCVLSRGTAAQGGCGQGERAEATRGLCHRLVRCVQLMVTSRSPEIFGGQE